MLPSQRGLLLIESLGNDDDMKTHGRMRPSNETCCAQNGASFHKPAFSTVLDGMGLKQSDVVLMVCLTPYVGDAVLAAAEARHDLPDTTFHSF